MLGGIFLDEKSYTKPHKLLLNNRRTGTISGVTDVISFDISEVLLETEQGMLTIKGADLHVNRLTLEKGEIDIEGRIDSLAYSEVTDYHKMGASLLGRLFK
jgi:sporulation protein YabP